MYIIIYIERGITRFHTKARTASWLASVIYFNFYLQLFINPSICSNLAEECRLRYDIIAGLPVQWVLVKTNVFQKVLWNWYHQNARVFCWQHIMLDGRVFQKTVEIPMGTNCAPLLVDLFLYSYEPDGLLNHPQTPKTSQNL